MSRYHAVALAGLTLSLILVHPWPPLATARELRQLDDDPPSAPRSAPSKPQFQYRPLSARACQCMAAEAAPAAALFDSQQQVSEGSPAGETRQDRQRNCRKLQLRRTLLYYSALDARNRAAGDALYAYYRLVQAEARRKLVHDSQAEVERTFREVDQLRERGLPVDLDRFEQQRFDLDEQRVDVDWTVDRLNGQLQPMLGSGPWDPATRIWPGTTYEIVDAPLDPEAEVAEGLDRHPELMLLRTVRHSLNADTLPTARDLLGRGEGLLAAGPAAAPLTLRLILRRALACHADPPPASDLAARGQQLDTLLAQREATVETEIRQAVREAETRLAQIEIARNKARYWQQRIAKLEAKAPAIEVSIGEQLAARLSLMAAKNDLFNRVIDWHLAIAKLCQAQGVLACDCESEFAEDAE